ncbi:sugar transferase, partial [Caballeronia sp. BR00000012568055]|uniref:sugar transferase n=1 Tax=Caballeronia sp. BR00000012568055 TaxID=2918761 RepID=UPI0023F96A56
MALADKVWESVSDDGVPEYAGARDSISSESSVEAAASQSLSFDDYDADDTFEPIALSDVAKRAMDILGSAALLVLLLPVFIALCLIVARDGGRPIFGHVRVGQGGRAFKCLKFRSMVTDADAVLADLLAKDSQAREEWNRDFKLKNDIRITPIGRLLRRTSLDELPQLWNVLRGDMSLVGPRPIVEKELPRYGKDRRYYLLVKPGMTG